jgi:cholesterol oxidase
MNEEFDYIVIGSGFGGSVSAHRLAEKGYRVLILEKGKEFQDKDFPKTNWDLKKYLWLPTLKFFGIQKLTLFKKVFILSGVGVGGGSLVYGNTLMTPTDKFFKNEIWSGLKDWKSELSPFYDIAKKMLGVTKNPLINKEDQILKEIAKDLGREKEFSNVDVGVYFGDTEKEVDPYFNGEGPLRSGCVACAGCMVGCRYNAKNTLVKNYLYFARKNGAEVKPETLAQKIEFKDKKYYIQTKSSTSIFNKNEKTYCAKGIVFSGGVLGTMDLLLKQKYKYKTLPLISNTIGRNIRTNSEMLCGVTSNEKLNNGIAISSVMNPDDETHIEIVKYPSGSNAMKFLAAPSVGPGFGPIRIIMILINIVKEPIRYMKVLFSSKWADNSVVFLIMQNLDSSMNMVLKKFPFTRMSLDSKGQKIPSYIKPGVDVMNRFAKKTNGFTQSIIPEVAFNIPATAHILGGAPIGKTDKNSVVDENFKVHNYPNMYICDGSMIPCNLGVNPSLSITALSEYTMSKIKKKEESI